MNPLEIRARLEAAYDARNARIVAHFNRHHFLPMLSGCSATPAERMAIRIAEIDARNAIHGERFIDDADILAPIIELALAA